MYRDVLDDPDWHELDADSCKTLVMLWLIASEDEGMEGVLPCARKLSFRLRISERVLNQRLTKLSNWLILNDIKPISEGYQKDAPEESRGETEREEEGETDICPHQKILSVYHSKCPSLPIVQFLSDGLKSNLKSRWREDEKRRDLKWWEWYFENVSLSDYLTGKINSWMASFGWLIGPKNMTKVLNGQYLNKGSKTDRAIEEFLDEEPK